MSQKLDIKQAKLILKIGLKDWTDENEEWAPVFEGDIPKDEKKAISEAEALVEMAQEAQEAEQDHPAIDKILGVAGYESDEDEESETDAGDEPWEGYDELKAGKVVRELSTIDDEDELAAVVNYEKANKNRDAIIEAAEEIAEENEWDLGAEGGEEEEDEDYKPWKGYDDQTVKKIVGQIKGMRPVGADFWQNMLDYEQANEDRARIKSEIEGKLEEVAEEGDSVADESETQEEYLSWDDIKDMDFGELYDLVEEYGEDPDGVIGGESHVPNVRRLVGEHYDLEIPDEVADAASDDEGPEDEGPEDEEEEGITSDLDWEVLSQMDLDELKGVVKENDLGFRAGPKSDLDKLREKIAEALEIQKPAEEPWRGYAKRKVDQILKKLSKLNDEQLGEVYAYESENQARKSIMKALDELAVERGLTNEEPEDEEDIDTEPEDEETSDTEIEEAEEDDDHKTDRRKRRARKAGKEEATSEEPDYDELTAHVTAKVEEENLAVPRPLPDNLSELPFDLTELSEKELRQLHSANLSYFGRSSHIARIEKQLAIACKNIADEKHDEAIANLEKIDPETEKEKSATQLKAEAESNPVVRRWRRRQHKHEEVRDAMRDEAAIYKQNLDSISRDWTMRIDEMDHSGGLGPRGKAGKAAGGKAKPKAKGRK